LLIVIENYSAYGKNALLLGTG